MKIPFINLTVQDHGLKSQLISEMGLILDSGRYLNGDKIKEFERAFAKYLNARHCISCGNGSDALEIALKGLGIKAGDEVIVPALSWVSTASAVKNVGAEPIFADILDEELTIDPVQAEKNITEFTKAIIPVHLHGLPAKMDQIMALSEKHGLYVIEDCAQAHGAAIDNRKVGQLGDIGVFSFYPTKNLGAIGHAGCLITNDGLIATKCRALTFQGQLGRNNFNFIGRNSAMDEIQAAALLAKLPYLDCWNDARIEKAGQYDQLLGPEIAKPKYDKQYRHVFHHYTIRAKNREIVIKSLTQNDIGYGIYYPVPLPFIKPFTYQGHKTSDFPVASQVCEEILSLPVYPGLTDREIDFVARAVNRS